VKLTDKPLSFWYSVVGSHSSLFQPPDSKNPAEAGFSKEWSWPISRVLSWTVIHLGQQSLTGSSSLPGFSTGRTLWTPIWPCSGWSLPCRGLLPAARCALTAPFHPYLIPLARAIGGLLSVALVVGCDTPQALPGTLPYGARTFLPSARLPLRGRRRSGDCLVSFGAKY